MNKLSRILILSATTLAVPAVAHADPVTGALFGAAFAATIPGQIVSIGFGIAATYGITFLRKKK
jgi:hypothetical protein